MPRPEKFSRTCVAISKVGALAFLCSAFASMRPAIAGAQVWPPPGSAAVLDTKAPIAVEGVSLLLPGDDRWAEFNEDFRDEYDWHVIGEHPPSDGVTGQLAHTTFVAIRTAHLEAPVSSDQDARILTMMKRDSIARQRSGLTTVSSESSIIELKDAHCRRYQYVAEESQRTQTPGLAQQAFEASIPFAGLFRKHVTLLQRENGLMCVHPYETQRLTTVMYSERVPKGEDFAQSDSLISQLLASVVFEKFDTPQTSIIPLEGVGHGIAVAGGAVWVGDVRQNRVVRIDPNSNTIVASMTVKSPGDIVATDSAVWVTSQDANRVIRIDPFTNKIVAEIKVGSRPQRLALGGGSLWVLNYRSRSINRIDPQANTVIGDAYRVPPFPHTLAYIKDQLWVGCEGDSALVRIDPERGTRVGELIPVGPAPFTTIFDGHSVWVADYLNGELMHFDAETDSLLDHTRVGAQAAGLVVAGGVLWVSAGEDGVLRRIDLHDGRFIGNPIAVSPGAFNIAATADAIWVPTSGGVMRVSFTPQPLH